jgi:17 kDa outer membrane surface antigen
MCWSGSSYIDEGRVRQSPPLVGPAAIALLAAALCGCSGLGLPLGESTVDRSLSTGSIETVSSKEQRKVAQSDWQAVRRGIAQTAADPSLNGTLDWRNPETGTTGTLTVLETVTATNDPNCRNFQTTINDMRGIRHYRGEACKSANDRWELFSVLADDSKLL